jgi:uncharacterized protein DUF3168
VTISEDIFAALTATSPAIRVYVDVMPPQVVLPALVYSIIAGEDDVDLRGRSGSARYFVELDAWATTRLGADELMAEAETRMWAATTFQVGSSNISGGTYIGGAGVEQFEAETGRYRASKEFSIRF